MTTKRINKTKEQIVADMKRKNSEESAKKIARDVFPFLTTNKTIYDSQTTVSAVSGYLKYELSKRINDIKVSNIREGVNELLKSEKKSIIKTAIVEILDSIDGQNVNDVTIVLDKISDGFGKYGAIQFLKKPMSELKMKDFIG